MSDLLTIPAFLRVRQVVIGLVWVAIDVYAIGLAGYVIAHALTGTRWWPVWVLSNFAHWLLLPLFFVLPLTLWRQRWLTAALSAVGVLAFLLSYGALFLPPMPPASAAVGEDTQSFTVMTYNIQNRRVPPDRLVEIVKAVDADIVGVVELGSGQAAALERNAPYPYQILRGTGASGLGLLSRYPIVEHEIFRLTAARRPYMRAVLDVNGQMLTVVVAHPPSPDVFGFSYQPNPATSADLPVLAELAVSGHPAILLGDLNTNGQSDDYFHLTGAGLVNAFRAAGWGFGATWPTPRLPGHISLPALIRIDHIFYTPELLAASAWVETSATNSDHLPVVAQLVWDQD